MMYALLNECSVQCGVQKTLHLMGILKKGRLASETYEPDKTTPQ